MNMKTAWISNRGGKEINDDTVSVWQENGTYLFVGDGLGGYAGGQQASQAAAKALLQAARDGSVLSEESLREAAVLANEAVRRLQQDSGGNMKTTLVFLAIEDKTARWMHIGDSRLYYFHDGVLRMQTMDHSVSQMAVLMGDITLQQIRFHEDRNRVLRALGAENAKPDVSTQLQLQKGDAFLLCTDGFWEYVYEQEMESALKAAKTPQEWLERMEQLLKARIPKDTDNYTAAAVIC